MIRRLAICSIFAIALPAEVLSQGSVRGVIQDAFNERRLGEATVALHKDTLRAAVAVTRSDSTGRFELRRVPAGSYWLSTRRIGYGHAVVPLQVGDRDTSVVVGLSGDAYRRYLERKDEETFLEALAKARSRPRKWTCETSDSLTKEYAEDWAYLAEAMQSPDNRADRDTYALPSDSASFVADFRPIRDPRECARIAESIDANSRGLIDDHLVIFRVGRIFVLPTFGWLADSTGKILAVFVD